ncbi:MAG: hypothetical protein JKX76_03895 [Colwellia sp.]|nr:hypothetical protein [Colwellia sp.]
MDIIEKSTKFLSLLHITSHKDYQSGYSWKNLQNLLGLNNVEGNNIVNYLANKKLIDTKSGFGDNISLTSEGIEYVVNHRKGKEFKLISFAQAHYLPSSRDAIEFEFSYHIIDEDQEDGSTVKQGVVKVSISGSLSSTWGFQIWDDPKEYYLNLEKILLQYGAEKVIEKLKEGTLNQYEDVPLLTTNCPSICPYNPDDLIETKSAIYEVEMPQKKLIEEIQENNLAATIIETRDYINTFFKEGYNQKLIKLDQERNLLDLFKTANSEEELSHRTASLAQLSRSFNVKVLRELTGEIDKQKRSVELLGIFLKSKSIQDEKITKTLQCIGRIRTGYPVHTDANTIKGLAYFGIDYPIKDYNDAWVTLLKKYLEILLLLKEIVADLSLAKENSQHQ